jgi:hypothetical protein
MDEVKLGQVAFSVLRFYAVSVMLRRCSHQKDKRRDAGAPSKSTAPLQIGKAGQKCTSLVMTQGLAVFAATLLRIFSLERCL